MDCYDVKKVVSIWLCMTSPGDKESGIAEYSFRERRIAGKLFRNDKKDYDLIQVVMVYIGKSDEIEDDFLKMLHLLFRASLKAGEKTRRLKNDFGIVLDHDMRKELNIMCNLSEGIAEEAKEEGLKEGLKEGRKEGENNATARHLRHIMHKMHLTLEDAMDMLEIPEADRSQYIGIA